ncbi:MAG: cyclodeaminase/cyclohydrolase family protein, partial [Firmicutes bacterium]|nr:cyclodeaminase/cyclohydrolase family protein [Bacillota bacterium]
AELTDKTNPNCASDLGVAILNLWAGMQGTWMNVKINLPGVKDEAKKAAFLAEGEKMMAEGKRIAEAKYEEILANL